MLALDRSESMRGRPLADAVAAAQAFVARPAPATTSASSRSAARRSRSPHSGTSPERGSDALGGLTVDTRAGTALYDAIVVAAAARAATTGPGRAIVVVTDGEDVSSLHTLDEAIAAAHAAHASVYTIGIGGPSFTPDALRSSPRETGGSYPRPRRPPRSAASTRRSQPSSRTPGRSATTRPPRPGDDAAARRDRPRRRALPRSASPCPRLRRLRSTRRPA